MPRVKFGCRRPQLALAPVLLVMSLARGAQARAGGIEASGCEGCHGSTEQGQLSLVPSPGTFEPGQSVELLLTISGGFSNGGVYLTTEDVGELQTIANQGLTKLSSGLVHNQPKPATDGNVQFRFSWVAPGTPGAVRFNVFALGGNANGRSNGDSGISGYFDFVYGCSGKTYYMDGDQDGVGRDDFPVLGCDGAPPPAYAGESGDCDDYRETTYPSAPELCNQRDDDCDGEIDEDAVPVELWPDADGDGYYDARTEKTGEPKTGCVGLKGWAAYAGDCRPKDPAIHAEAKESCNNVDDDCDGDVDERVRPVCGEGWCRREAPGCDLANCVPGVPTPETCNFLDDDCDGLTDEDADLCPSGQTCAAGACVDSDSVMLEPTDDPKPGNGAGAPPAGEAGGPRSISTAGDASGCALGARAGHGGLAALTLLTLAPLLRRRRRARVS